MLALTQPVVAPDRRTPAQKCGLNRVVVEKTHHPYDVLLAKDMSEEIEANSLMCLYHQNQMTRIDLRLMKNEFEHQNLYLRYYNKDIAEICLKNTKYEPLLRFAIGDNFTVLFGNDLAKIGQIIRISKKYPQAILMAAMVDQRRLITVKQLESIAKSTDIQLERAKLCATLSAPSQSLLSSLNRHTTELSRLLGSHSSQEKPTTSD